MLEKSLSKVRTRKANFRYGNGRFTRKFYCQKCHELHYSGQTKVLDYDIDRHKSCLIKVCMLASHEGVVNAKN